jgi:hypothetical protein
MATLLEVLKGYKPYDPLVFGSQQGYNAKMIINAVPGKELAREVVYHDGGYHYVGADGKPEPAEIFRYYDMTPEEANEAYRH